MNELAAEVLRRLKGKTLVTAESCTGGGIGAALTAIAGSSSVYKGGVICYCDDVKAQTLGVSREVLKRHGAVSEPVAAQMAERCRKLLQADICLSVTGLAGPDGDGSGYRVGTVFIGYESETDRIVRKFVFSGDREAVRRQAICAALQMVLEYQK